MLLKLIFFIFFAISYVIRALLWLTRLQQKEYRRDRLWSYLVTPDGIKELLKIFPRKKDLTRIGLVRPKFTLRMMVISLFLQILVLVLLIKFYPLSLLGQITFYLLVIFFVPFLSLLANLPAAVIFEWQVAQKTKQAQAKIAQGKPKIIGITGSYGKTSTKIILQHVLQQKYSVYATPKSFNTRYSLTRDIADHYQGQEIAIIEYAAYKPGEIQAVAQKIAPDWAVITGFTQQHLALFKSIDNIIQAKAELIRALNSDGLVFYNAQDEGVKQIIALARAHTNELTDEQFIACSGSNSLIKLTAPKLNSQGKLSFIFYNQEIQTKLVGYRYLTIIQTVMTIATQLKLSSKQIITGLQTFQPPIFFVNFFQHQDQFWVLDDGRTTNQVAFMDVMALTQTISTKKKLTGKKYLLTSGIVDLGSQSDSIHLELAKQAKTVFTNVIYNGNVGQEQFHAVFGDQLITNTHTITTILASLSDQDLLVIEGFIPLWLQNYLIVKK